jgi:ribonuclease T2
MKLLQISLVLVLVAPIGCKSPNPPAPTPRTSSIDSATVQTVPHAHGGPEENGQPGTFDFYLLNLSWSPEFCATHPGNSQCAARPGFVVHGLWPQNNDGTFPENCGGMPKPPNTAAYLDIMPTIELILHEWKAHGTCSGLNPDGYFSRIRAAFRSVAIPSMFAATQTPPTTIRPSELLAQFSRANPSFPPDSFALTCGNNFLTAVEVCFDKNLKPESCRAVRSCRANVIKIPPR